MAEPLKKKNEAFKEISISDFTYELPEGQIAKFPLEKRDQSKLLIYRGGKINDDSFANLPKHLSPGTLLVFNNTKVIQARLHFQKSTGAKIEIFCLEPTSPSDFAMAFQAKAGCSWKCIVGNAKKWKEGFLEKEIEINGKIFVLKAEKTADLGDSRVVSFSWEADMNFGEILEVAGIIPIPPYLDRDSEASDLERYQTVYSKIKGSVAAPTAGLHFTEKVFSELNKKGIEKAELTLHVGAGTFQPVKSETIDGHDMHTEHILVTRTFLEKLHAHLGKVIAVGTTSIRTLESLFWMGCKVIENPSIQPSELNILQWDPYEKETNIPAEDAITAIIDFMDRNELERIASSTQIIIVPGYTFRIIHGMITNFHQPQSTLLLLISAFLGDHWKRIYQHALEQNYRFLSYGDSNLYLKE